MYILKKGDKYYEQAGYWGRSVFTSNITYAHRFNSLYGARKAIEISIYDFEIIDLSKTLRLVE